jgi:hypothetical protein
MIMFVPKGCGHITQQLGRLLLEDDRQDFGQMGRMHHWQLGLAMIIAGGLLKSVEQSLKPPDR